MAKYRALLILILLLLACRDQHLFISASSAPPALATPSAPVLSESSLVELNSKIDGYLENGGMVVNHEGRILYDRNGQQLFIPASTLKIATALAAIHYLGLDYRFRTEFYLSALHDLTIRGYGDPFLISEEWDLIVQELVSTAQIPIHLRNIYIDTSAYSDEIHIPGIESGLDPYNARNGALAVNFNTINVTVEPGGGLRSAESQTPLTPLAYELAGKLAPGTHRINISRDLEMPSRYAGELAHAFLTEKGFEIAGRIVVRERTEAEKLIHTHYNSRKLSEVIEAMMLYSNNFIANQLLLSIGLAKDGEPATLEKGVRALNRFLIDELSLDPADFTVVEGSGLSRQNRFTPRALAEVVRAFHPYRHLLAKQDGISLKTGTLTGVYALAGYLPSERPLCFVIILNQPQNTREGILRAIVTHIR